MDVVILVLFTKFVDYRRSQSRQCKKYIPLPGLTPLEPGTAGNTLNRYFSVVIGPGTGTNPSYTWRCWILPVGRLPSTWWCRGDEKFDGFSASLTIMLFFYTKSDLLKPRVIVLGNKNDNIYKSEDWGMMIRRTCKNIEWLQIIHNIILYQN